MYEIKDEFLWTKENKVITRDKHHVPGLANISHWNFKGATTPAEMHYHSGIYEMHCMIHGKRTFQTYDNGQQHTHIVTGNQVAITFPRQVHGYLDNFVEPYEFFSMQIDVSDPEHMLGLDRTYSIQLCSELESLKETLLERRDQRLKLGGTHINLLRTAFSLFSYFDEESIRTGVQFLSCFLFTLKYLSPITEDEPGDENISAAIKYMGENFLSKPSLDVLADKAGYSLSYFKYKFKEETGMTPANYLSMLRLEYAKEKLAGSNYSITKLASELNFSSPSHFCSTFKKLTNSTPTQYRRRRGDQ